MKHPAPLAAVLVLSAGTVLVPAAAHAATPATAAFSRLAQWPAGYVGSITVRNDTAATIDGWRVGFDLTGGTRVTSSHSAVFSHSGDRYTVTNESWNGRLVPGSSATFGWVAEGQGTPAGCTLNGASCTGTPADFTAPVRPGPLAFDISKGLTVSWAPSAGDGEQVAYQVFESERLLATVTEPRYVYSSGGALPPRIYIFAVRAVDPAGNVSPASYRSVGRIWRGDEIPAAPGGLRAETPADGPVRLSWTAPPAGSPFAVPPVAGYEILLDGQPAGETGGTTVTLPAPPPGPHAVGVRTLNAVGNTSAATELTLP